MEIDGCSVPNNPFEADTRLKSQASGKIIFLGEKRKVLRNNGAGMQQKSIHSRVSGCITCKFNATGDGVTLSVSTRGG